MSLIVDASVAARWVIPGWCTPKIKEVFEGSDVLFGPSLLIAEVGNTLWKAVRAGEFPASRGLNAIQIVLSRFEPLAAMLDLHVQATSISLERNFPVYDCYYLSLAQNLRYPLVTADKRLSNFVHREKLDVEIRLISVA